ncbi:MAG: OmpA family protein [Bryobacteraceae bacterium]
MERATEGTPVFRVTVVSRSIKAINYHHRQGSTVVGLAGTGLAPRAKGEAKIDSKTGATKIDINVDKMVPAQELGNEYLTYVVWAVTPEGRAENLGELMLDGDHARVQTASELQTFGLIVTAEPYFAVTQPSDVVVMEGVIKQGTLGTISPIEAKYELLSRGSYTARLPAAGRTWTKQGRDTPLDVLEARHAVAIARSVGADKYAPDTMQKADVDIQNMEGFLRSKGDKKKIQSLARNAAQLSEDARIIAMKRAEEDRLEAERVAAEKRVSDAKDEAERQARQRELADAQKREAQERERNANLMAEQAQRATERANLEQLRAEAAAKDAERRRTEAEDATRLAIAKAESVRTQAAADLEAARKQQEALRGQVADAEAARLQAEQERQRVRAELQHQLNLVLETRESARGLIVNMSDVLFDTARYTLKPGAREKLAKMSGIILTHPGLKMEVEGHTDSVGGDEYNQKLSEQRADSVRQFLIEQGVNQDAITSRGFGKTKPVATNDTAAGRQRNRRVEIVVSGAPIESAPATTGDARQ